MTFDLNVLTGVTSIMTFACMWLFLRPQQIENASIHKSLDRMTDAIDKLREELKASSDDRSNMRTNIKTLFHKYDELKEEISEMRKDVKEEIDEMRRTTCSHCDSKKIMNSILGIFDMLKENEQYSLTRVLPTLGYITFIIVSVYLAFNGKTWGHYTEFATATGGSVIIQLGNKFINSRYNTPLGSVGKNIGEEKKND